MKTHYSNIQWNFPGYKRGDLGQTNTFLSRKQQVKMLLAWLSISSFMLVGINATCLNNYQYQFTSEWKHGQGYRTNAIIKTDFNYPLKDWTLEIEFKQPLLQPMTTWVTKGDKGRSGQSKVKLTAEHYNKVLNQWNSQFEMSYFVDFKNRQGRDQIVCAQFCGTRSDTGEEICDAAQVTTRRPTTKQTTPATTQKTTRATTQKTTRATTKKTTRATTQKTTRATTQKTTRSTTQKTTRATTQKTTRATTQKTTQATTKKPTQPTTKKHTTRSDNFFGDCHFVNHSRIEIGKERNRGEFSGR